MHSKEALNLDWMTAGSANASFPQIETIKLNPLVSLGLSI